MIVVTAPTSTIGRQVIPRLLDGGEPVRVIARDPARLPAATRELVEVVPGSHGDPAVIEAALDGADAVFWLVPPAPAAASAESAYLDFTRPAAKAFTTQRVVGVSALGRGTPMAGRAGPVTASLAMDDLIAGTGVAYRSLALPSFMDNLLRQVATVRDEGVFRLAISGDRRFPSAATRDIAAVAAELLLDDAWSGTGSVAVLGPEDLSFDEMAEIMTEVLWRPVRFERISAETFQKGLTGRGMSAAMAAAMADMMRAKDEGLDNAEPRTEQATTPTTFRRWCEEVLKPAVQTG